MNRLHLPLFGLRFLFLLLLTLVGLASVAVAISPTDSPLPPAKQAIVNAYASLEAAGQANPGPKQPEHPTPGPMGQGVTITGSAAGAGWLVAEADTIRPAGDSEDLFTNSWYMNSPSLNVDVWAGARGTDPSQGFLMVVLWDSQRLTITGGGIFDTPRHDGIVRIAGAVGTTLTVTGAGSSTFTFDVSSLSYQ